MKNLKPASPSLSNVASWKLGLPGVLLILISGLLLVSGCSSQDSEPVVRWIGIHSLKGGLFPEEVGDEKRGGLSLISGYIRQYDDPLVFATNGTIHGSPHAYLSKGQIIIEGLNSMGLDALFVDSRELYFGARRLSDLAVIANFPLVASNIVISETGEIPPYLEPYFYHEQSATLFVGLGSPLLEERNLPENIRGLGLIPLEQAVTGAIETARNRSLPFKHVVVMAVGYKADRQSANQFVDEAIRIPEVSMLVIGNRDLQAPTLQRLTRNGRTKHLLMVDDTIFDGAKTVDYLEVHQDFSRVSQEHLPVRSGVIEPDPVIGEAIFRSSAAVEELLRDQITLSSERISHNPRGESPLANVILDACRSYWNTDVALINSGAVRGSLGPGAVTLADLYASLPFEGTVVLLGITGRELIQVLQKSGEFWGDPQRENGFLQVSGLQVAYQRTGSHLLLDSQDVRVGGRPVDPHREYTVAVERYLYAGGDGYTNFRDARLISDTMVSSLSVMLQHLRNMASLDSAVDGRITIE